MSARPARRMRGSRERPPRARVQRRVFGAGVLLALAALGCARHGKTPDVTVRFGVFFGGQIQDRSELPLVLDRARQSIGIRVEFGEPARAPRRVRWELEKPTPNKKASDPTRVVAYGDAEGRAGTSVLDVPLAFQPGDRPGNWRVRVAVDGKNVLDRAVLVTPPSEAPTER